MNILKLDSSAIVGQGQGTVPLAEKKDGTQGREGAAVVVSFSNEALGKAERMGSSLGEALNKDWRYFLKGQVSQDIDVESADTKQLLADFLRGQGINNHESFLSACVSCGACTAGGGDLTSCPVGVWDRDASAIYY